GRHGGCVIATPAYHRAEYGPFFTSLDFARTSRRVSAQQFVGVVFSFERHSADNRKLVGNLRLQRHELTQVQAWHVCLDRIELPSEFYRRVRFWVVHINVTWSARQIDHNHRLSTRVGNLTFDCRESRYIAK